MDMGKITVACWQRIKAGETVASGFGYDLKAPKEEGTYTLYELYNPETNTHRGWKWEKEES